MGVLLLLALGGVSPGHPLPSPYPPHVFDVTKFGAKGAPHDDTVAVGTAVDAIVRADKDWKFPPEQCVEHPVGPSVLFFPAGSYILSDTIQLYPTDNSTCKLHDSSLMIVVMGESSESTTVRLADHAAGYNDPAAPKPLFLTHPGTAHNDGQWLSYIDLHIEIGQGNTGAIALRHVANNIGGVEHVRLSAPYGGAAGIDFPLFLGGLTLFKHVDITGFSIGVNVSQPQDILTIEHLRELSLSRAHALPPALSRSLPRSLSFSLSL